MRISLRCAFLFLSLFVIAACGGQVVRNESLKDIDPATFDGVIVSYFLPRAELTVSAAYNPEKDVVIITRGDAPKILPDVNHHYHAVYRHSEFSNDEVTIQTDANGLLKQISTTTTDQTTAIVKKIGEIAQEFGSLQKALRPESFLPKTDQQAKPCPALNATVTTNVTYTDSKFKVRSDDGGGCTLKLQVRVEPTTPLDVAAYPATALQTERKTGRCPMSAVCFRTTGGFKAIIKATLTKSQEARVATNKGDIPAEDNFTFVAPDVRHTGVLFFNRRAFVANTTTADFENGMLTKLSVKDPSAIAGMLDLPIEILKSLTIFVKIK